MYIKSKLGWDPDAMFLHIQENEVNSRNPTDCKVDRISGLLKAYNNSSNNQCFDILPSNVSPKKKIIFLKPFLYPLIIFQFTTSQFFYSVSSFYFFLTFVGWMMTFKEAIQHGLTMPERNNKTVNELNIKGEYKSLCIDHTPFYPNAILTMWHWQCCHGHLYYQVTFSSFAGDPIFIISQKK